MLSIVRGNCVRRYSISLTALDGRPESESAAITFEAQNHDDIFAIIDRLDQARLLPEGETAEFALGLKLFSEVVLRHRREPLFAEMSAAMGTFMKHLKAEERG